MKFGMLISIAIVVGVAGVVTVLMRGNPDKPTKKRSAPELFEVQSFDPSLPEIFSTTASGDAATEYKAALSRAKSGDIQGAAERLVSGMDLDKCSYGFLDNRMELRPGAQAQSLEGEMTKLFSGINKLVNDSKRNGEQRILYGRALWVFGKRVFENNLRLSIRNRGLLIMASISGPLAEAAIEVGGLHGDVAQQLAPYMQAISEIQRKWNTKTEVLISADPHVGDLINITQKDKDKTFTLEGVLQLGVAQWTNRERGNLRVMDETITKYLTHEDQMIADAAKAAKSFTREDFRAAFGGG